MTISYDRKTIFTIIGISGLVILAVLLRYIGLGFISQDMTIFLIPWYDNLAHNKAALGGSFSNYAPSYLYLLALLTMTELFIPKVVGIKLISILFDGLSSIMIYKLVELKYPKTRVPLFAALIFLVLPSIILNSSVWGQADSIYTFFLLGCLLFILQGRPKSAVIFFSIALSFKLQTIFLAPFFVVLSLKKIIPWRFYGFAPLIYCIFALPSVLAGRPWSEVLLIYLSQASTYVSWSLHAPNPYIFVASASDQSKILLVIMAASLLIAAWIWQATRRSLSSKSSILMGALASVALVPYLMPRMHERYFYPMDVLTFVIAFYEPGLWFLPVFSQISSVLTYTLYLFGGDILYQLVGAFFLTTSALVIILKKQFSLPMAQMKSNQDLDQG